jgi:hypothetical protein
MPLAQTAVPQDDEDLDPDATDAAADPDADPAAAGAAGEGEDDEDAEEEVVVQIGDEPPPGSEEAGEQDDEAAKPWVRELRQKQRDLVRENRELRAERAQREAAASTVANQPPETGEEPTLESSDFDAEKFKRDLLAWHKRKADADAAQQKREKDAKAATDAWQATLASHEKAAKALKVRDFADAEDVVKDALSVVQQGILVQGAGNSALLTYALGKNPAKLKELAALTDPVKFAFALAKLETEVKVTPRLKQTPQPESRVRGSASFSGVGDRTLARLKAEADTSGDRTKVAKYMREQNAAAAARKR